jgi:hypothetical protein
VIVVLFWLVFAYSVSAASPELTQLGQNAHALPLLPDRPVTSADDPSSHPLPRPAQAREGKRGKPAARSARVVFPSSCWSSCSPCGRYSIPTTTTRSQKLCVMTKIMHPFVFMTVPHGWSGHNKCAAPTVICH